MVNRTIADDADCTTPGCCGAIAQRVECCRCGVTARITECGHLSQPRPIASGTACGNDATRIYCAACAITEDRVREIAAHLEDDHDDGTADLGCIIRQALCDDPSATVADVRAICVEARRDVAAERNQ